MEAITRNYVVFSRLIFIFRIFGITFLKLKKLSFLLRRFVFKLPIVSFKDKLSGEEELATTEFVANCESLTSLLPELITNEKALREDLHAYGLNSNIPTGCLLITKRDRCRSCGKSLSLEKKPHNIMVYDLKYGPLAGTRMTKVCRKCKIYEHFGYWTLEGLKHYDREESLNGPYLLTSEETAIDIDLLKDMTNLLIVGAVPFSTYAKSYNRRFGRRNNLNTDQENGSENLRKERETIFSLFQRRKNLDRRRLEEGFILYASLDVMGRHNIDIQHFPYDKSELAKTIVLLLHGSFVAKWADHRCEQKGCKNVMVIDGNMKNARQVCSCKSVTHLEFKGMDGGITVGCLNTPSKASRLCKEHVMASTSFRNDEKLMVGLETEECDKEKEQADDLLPICVINDKVTRNGKFLEIKWSNGCTSWVKESFLPSKFVENKTKVKIVEIEEIGQKKKEYRLVEGNSKENDKLQTTFKSHGFAVHHSDDNSVFDDDSKKVRVLVCGTEKGKHKCKNAKTAGVLVFERPCGVVVDVRELYGSESKSQVYGHLHSLMEEGHMCETEVICYDDACHLKKFSKNPRRSEDTETSKILANMEMVCDRFHFPNHTDKWCRRNCNPNNCPTLKDVNTEVCEQLFSWLSNFSRITKHMNRYRFLFLMLYVLDCHNEDIQN